jgi:hypothetical protein
MRDAKRDREGEQLAVRGVIEVFPKEELRGSKGVQQCEAAKGWSPVGFPDFRIVSFKSLQENR